jgi:transposase
MLKFGIFLMILSATSDNQGLSPGEHAMARPSRLTAEQHAELRSLALSTRSKPPWWHSTADLCHWVSRAWGISYSEAGMARVLRAGGLHYWRHCGAWREEPVPRG